MRNTKKLLSLLVALIMVITALPINVISAIASATDKSISITVENNSALPGTNVDVNITIKDNPGVLGASITVNSSDEITLVDAKNGPAFEMLSFAKPGEFSNKNTFVWDGETISEADIKDGIILTLTYKIADNASVDTKFPVTIECEYGDIIDVDLNPVETNIVNGNITVIDYTPGDVNQDGKITTTDVVFIRRYMTGGYTLATFNENAADVNADGKINTTDIVMIRRYIVDGCKTDPEGYNITLKPSTSRHIHNMEATERVEATCTAEGNIAYWQCTDCGKYYSDVKGIKEVAFENTIIPKKDHEIVVDEAVPADYGKTGLTEGSHCANCDLVIVAQEIIPALKKTEYSITYHITNNDNYLQSIDIINRNNSYYASEDGLPLQDLIVDGYNFKGWYTSQTGGTKITEIPVGSKGNKTLYAQWEKVVYTIDFDSPDAPMSPVEYTVDRGITLTNPSWFGYTFVGWSKDGEIVSKIDPGTTGNIVLHANWTSNRNKARAVDKLGNPNIIEDADNGRYLFVYEIGTIENVPLSEDKGEQINSEGVTITKEISMSKSVQEGTADKIAQTVSKATTETSAWTLSEDWNSSTSATNEHDEQIGKTSSRTDSEGNVIAGKYYVSNSQGGSTSVSSSVGGSTSNSSKVTTGASMGINGEYSRKITDGTSVNTTTSKTNEKEFDWNLGGSYGQNKNANIGANAGAEEGGLKAGLSAGLSKGSNWGINGGIGGSNKTTNTNTVSKDKTHEDEKGYKISNSRNFSVGTERNSTSEGHWDTSSSSSSNWNSTSGYESSKETSQSTTISNAISEVINDKYSYTSMDSRGGSNSSTRSTGDTESLSNEYASTVEFSTENVESEKKTLQFKSSATGYYRVITAGTVHVFGVVGYDIATNSYFTYTYNVLDNERHAYLDYSKDHSGFKDCENGIIPFEIPYAVHEYISVKIGRSEGLRINEETGEIKSYNGNAEYVVIPEYVSVTDGLNKPKAVKITGFSKDAFSGNTTIKGVILPKHIREIPNDAFNGCTSLETVIGEGITKIGKEAFKNCVSLETFIIDEFVEELGDNAFENAFELYINVSNDAVARAAFKSGAKNLIVYLPNMLGSIDDSKIEIPSTTDFFALLSDGKAYRNLSIESNSGETFLSNFRLVENIDTPLKLNSKTVTLSRVIVENSPGFSLILTQANTNLKLYGNISLSSKSENTVLSKNVDLSLLNNEVDGTMSITGNWLINDKLTNEQKLSVDYTNGRLIQITEEDFNNYLTSSRVSFDPNGGELEADDKIVYYGQTYGDLPVPTRANYTFEGWYTDSNNGTLITSTKLVSALVNQKLYAHWTPNMFEVSFDADGGDVPVSSKTITFGNSIGELPTPSKDYHRFDGWYTEPGTEGTKITSDLVPDAAKDFIVYAHWTENDLSDWVLASNVPDNATVINNKYTYTLRSYTTSGSSSMSGWTKYDTKRTSWGSTQGPVYSNPSNGSRNVWSEQYETSRTYYYYWHHYANSAMTKFSSGQSSTYTDYHSYKTTSMLSSYGQYNAYKYWHSSSNYWLVWYDGEGYEYTYGTRWYYQEPVYTYYYYKDENKESTSNPTGQSNVSNVQEWVQYRVK